jgi:predicted RNase H-like nuclease (RuvC/YqgF family)
MTKFVITKNGNTITHIPAFTTRSQAEEYIIAIGGEGYEVAEAFDVTPAESEHINEDGNCWCGSLDCLGNMRVMSDKLAIENANLKAENAILKSETERLKTNIKSVTEFIQGSIDRDEWTESELEEIFWEELTNYLEIDLKQTEEIEVTFTATYSAWVTVPKNTDITDLEIDLAWHPDVTLNGDGVGSANQDNVEVDPA